VTTPWLKIGGAAAGVLAAGTLLGFAVVAAMREARALVEKGEELSDARWRAELALKEAEAERRIADARAEGEKAGAAAAAEAETKRAAAVAALRKARNEDPDFDRALSVPWPDAYFDSVCGQTAGCRPPS